MAIPIFEANNYGYHILCVCFLMSMHSGLNYRTCSYSGLDDRDGEDIYRLGPSY